MFEKKTKDSETPAVDLSGLNAPTAATEKPVAVPPELLTPAAQAYMNAQLRETVAALFREMSPVLKDIALTPEKIELMESARRAPSTDEVARKDRERREKELTRQDVEQARENLQRTQSSCSHRYPTGSPSIARTMNFPDRQPRFSCMKCMAWFTPREWRIGAPDHENPRGKATVVDAHPLYSAIFQEYQTTHNEA